MSDLEASGGDTGADDSNHGEPKARKFKLKKTGAASSSAIEPLETTPPPSEGKSHNRRHTQSQAAKPTKEKRKKETKCIDCRSVINIEKLKEPVVKFPCKHMCHQKCAMLLDGLLTCPRCTDDDSGDDYDHHPQVERAMLPLPTMDQVVEGPHLRFITRYRVSRALAHDYSEQICVPHNEALAFKFQNSKMTEEKLYDQWVKSKSFLSFLWSPITIDVLRENRVRVSTLLQKDINFKELFDARLIVVLDDLTKLSMTLSDVTYNKELLSVGMIDSKFNGGLRSVDFVTTPDKPFFVHVLECMSIPEPKKRLIPAEVQRLNMNILRELKVLDRNQVAQARELFIRSLRFVTYDEWQKTLGMSDECLKMMKITATHLRSATLGNAPALGYKSTRKAPKPYSDDSKRIKRRRPSDSDDETSSSDEDTQGTDSDE